MVVAGIVENMFANSLEEDVFPSIIYIGQDDDKRYAFAEIKVGKERQQTMAAIKEVWEILISEYMIINSASSVVLLLRCRYCREHVCQFTRRRCFSQYHLHRPG